MGGSHKSGAVKCKEVVIQILRKRLTGCILEFVYKRRSFNNRQLMMGTPFAKYLLFNLIIF